MRCYILIHKYGYFGICYDDDCNILGQHYTPTTNNILHNDRKLYDVINVIIMKLESQVYKHIDKCYLGLDNMFINDDKLHTSIRVFEYYSTNKYEQQSVINISSRMYHKVEKIFKQLNIEIIESSYAPSYRTAKKINNYISLYDNSLILTSRTTKGIKIIQTNIDITDVPQGGYLSFFNDVHHSINDNLRFISNIIRIIENQFDLSNTNIHIGGNLNKFFFSDEYMSYNSNRNNKFILASQKKIITKYHNNLLVEPLMWSYNYNQSISDYDELIDLQC